MKKILEIEKSKKSVTEELMGKVDEINTHIDKMILGVLTDTSIYDVSTQTIDGLSCLHEFNEDILRLTEIESEYLYKIFVDELATILKSKLKDKVNGSNPFSQVSYEIYPLGIFALTVKNEKGAVSLIPTYTDNDPDYGRSKYNKCEGIPELIKGIRSRSKGYFQHFELTKKQVAILVDSIITSIVYNLYEYDDVKFVDMKDWGIFSLGKNDDIIFEPAKNYKLLCKDDYLISKIEKQGKK
jgi:hypothetical protein